MTDIYISVGSVIVLFELYLGFVYVERKARNYPPHALDESPRHCQRSFAQRNHEHYNITCADGTARRLSLFLWSPSTNLAPQLFSAPCTTSADEVNR